MTSSPARAFAASISAGIAEVVQVVRFGVDALNPVFRVDGRVGERLVYRGEEPRLSSSRPGEPMLSTLMAAACVRPQKLTAFGWPTSSTPISPSAPPRSRLSPTRSPPFTARCCRAIACASCRRISSVPAGVLTWPNSLVVLLPSEPRGKDNYAGNCPSGSG